MPPVRTNRVTRSPKHDDLGCFTQIKDPRNENFASASGSSRPRLSPHSFARRQEPPETSATREAPFNQRLYQQSADLIEVARSAGSMDPDLAALWIEGEQRRLRGMTPVVHSWAVARALRKRLSERDTLDILWSLMGPDNYRLFVTERGWPPESMRNGLQPRSKHCCSAKRHPRSRVGKHKGKDLEVSLGAIRCGNPPERIVRFPDR